MADAATAVPSNDTPPVSKAAVSQKELVQKLVDAGVHFGHPVSRWNPRMEPYIYGRRGNVHLIDIKETVKGLLRAKQLIKKFVADGKDILFVGTKRQAREPVKREVERCGMHFVVERWLGGTLTNYRTIRARLDRLDELDQMWESGEIDAYSKKMKATLGRERTKIKTNLEGIRRMDKMPGLIFLIDVRREKIAVKEAKKLGIPVIALIDTDGNPEDVDLPIPGNDDAMRAIDAIMVELAEAVIEGKKSRPAPKSEPGAQGGPTIERGARRSSRSRFQNDQAGQPAAVVDGEGVRKLANPDKPGEVQPNPAPVQDEAPVTQKDIPAPAKDVEPPVEPVGSEPATAGLPTEKLDA
jgi:small subunit ribosomal protein S2